MVWIGGTVVIGSVATCTSIWRDIIIAVVACSTVIGDFCVGTCNDIKLIVYGEGCRTPSRRSCVTGSAFTGNAQRFMVGIERCVKICLMASVAGIGRVDITVGMTLDAVIGYGSMGPC